MSDIARCPSCGSFYRDEEGTCPREGTGLQRSNGLVERYRIVGRLGHGSMGVVYRAQHTLLGRMVAIKLLYRELARDPRTVNRFFREARAATAVQSPHIVEVTDFGLTSDGDAFLVMELLEGTSLRDLLNREKVLPLLRACTITLQIADGLHAAHGKGIVHRDLKPENVLLVPEGGQEQVKLLDFGIAQLSEFKEVRLTEAGIVLGTPAYMSPEQAAGEPIDQRTDIYSLGTILYEMLTGRCPFEGETAKELLVRKLTQGYPPPRELRAEIPMAVEAVILIALERKPDRRASTMLELSQELRDAMISDTGPIQKVVPVPVDQRPGALPVPEEEPLPESGFSALHFEPSLVRRILPFAGIGLGLVLGILLTLLFTRSGSKGATDSTRDARATRAAAADAGRVVHTIEPARPRDAQITASWDPRPHRRRKNQTGGRPGKTKRVAEAQPGTKRHPTPPPSSSKWMATVTSDPASAEVYDENERLLGRTPLRLPTDTARTVTLHRVGNESHTLKIPAHSTSTFHGKLKASTMSWEVLSLGQLKKMYEGGQISRFTYHRRRTELLRKRDEKLFELKIKLKLHEITEEQYERQAKSIKDAYK